MLKQYLARCGSCVLLRVLLFARPQIAFHLTPLKKYCSPDPSNISNLYCDPNTKYAPSKILGPILYMVTKFFRLKEVSISTGLRDQNMARDRANSAVSRDRIKCNLGSGEKYIRSELLILKIKYHDATWMHAGGWMMAHSALCYDLVNH